MGELFQILGIKRIVILLVLIGINGIVGAVTYLYVMPHNDDLTRQLQTITANVTSKRKDTGKLEGEYNIIQKQKANFEDLRGAGFFSNQNRAVARQRITDIQKFSNVLSAKYDITAASIEKNPLAADSGDVVLNSPVNIKVDALDDVDFYNFVYWVENGFPGLVSVKNIKVTRITDVNETTLRAIGSGIPVTLVNGEVSFEWRTMVPAKDVTITANPPGSSPPAKPKG
ncbi:MAG TPA: hypothetical protein VL625_11420 [Patescibacteria group bacterium]|jgi:hypothetical protein|nr:hypothetical protein [Patescibacteria group bacterium]